MRRLMETLHSKTCYNSDQTKHVSPWCEHRQHKEK